LMPSDPTESDFCFAQGPSSNSSRGTAAGAVQWLPDMAMYCYNTDDEEVCGDNDAVSVEDLSPSRRFALLKNTDSSNNPDFQCMVKNTFIDIAMPPSPRSNQTDGGNARRRSKSLPKDMGSPKRMPKKASLAFDDIEEESIFDDMSPKKREPPALRCARPREEDHSSTNLSTESDTESYELGSGDETATSPLNKRRAKCLGTIGDASSPRNMFRQSRTNYTFGSFASGDVEPPTQDWGRVQWDRDATPWI